MKNNISKKLYSGLINTYIIVLFIAITGIVCIYVLKNTAQKLVIEYNELESIQEARLSFNKTVPFAYDFLYSKHEHDFLKFEYYINKAYLNIEICNKNLSNRHNKEILDTIKVKYDKIYSTVSNFKTSSDTKLPQTFVHEIESIIYQINSGFSYILSETNKEIQEYVVIYETASNHSTLAIIFLTLILVFIGIKWGSSFVKRITSPIMQLLESTKYIADGNFNIRTSIHSKDELEELSRSFNRMTEKLQEITVSRNYFDNILSSMADSLIITNIDGVIESYNKATIDLLGYKEGELIGSHILLVLKSEKNKGKLDFRELTAASNKQNNEKIYKSKEGQEISVLFSISTLSAEKGKLTKYILLAHDLRDRKLIEEKLNQERKDRLVAINEAQEKERLKIATEIHDGLGQMLTGISYSLNNYFIDKFKDDKEYNEMINQLSKQIDDTIKESKTIAYDLMPFLLKDFGLVTAIENLVKETELKSNIKFNFQTYNCENRFNEKLEKAIYRIIQEAINNIIKHSYASKSDIQIIKHDESLSIVIEDNGVGFISNFSHIKTKSSGIGLISMHERVHSFNGFININSEMNRGTEIVIEIPCLNKRS